MKSNDANPFVPTDTAVSFLTRPARERAGDSATTPLSGVRPQRRAALERPCYTKQVAGAVLVRVWARST